METRGSKIGWGQALSGIALLLVGAAILYPVFLPSRAGVHSISVLSHGKMLAVGTAIYAADFDDHWPVARLRGEGTALGWAGRIFPYVKNDDIFTAPDDFEAKPTNEERPIAFGFNAHAARSPLVTAIASPAKTLLIVEVSRAHADFGPADRDGRAPRLSPTADGTPGGVRDSLDARIAPHVRYAMGLFGQKWDTGPPAKRSGGTMIAFADSHVQLCRPPDLARIGRDWTFAMP